MIYSRRLRRSVLCLLAGAGLSWASLTFVQDEVIHVSEWKSDHPTHTSDYEVVNVWGWPVYWAIDSPFGGVAGEIELSSEWRVGRALVNWLLFSIGILFLLDLYTLLCSGRRGHRQRPSLGSLLYGAGVGPFATFPIVSLSYFFFVLLHGGLQRGFWEEVGFALAITVYPTAATYVVMFVLGLPTAFVLRRNGRFELRRVLVLGALMGGVPLFLFILATEQRTFAKFLSSLPIALVGTASGLACAFVFWSLAVSTGDDATG